MAAYDQDFIRYAAQSSAYAARAVTGRLMADLAVASVLDVGCAAGTWLRVWGEQGAATLHGVDGDYVDRALLEIRPEQFTSSDLNEPFDLGRRFDLVQSLEVAEHVRPENSAIFVDNLARHAERFVLFSAAPPGQGGEHHVNERPLDDWRRLFEAHGFVALDAVRPAILHDPQVSFWYRYNTLLYVREAAFDALPETLKASRLPAGRPVPDLSPAAFRLRKAVVRRLPYRLQHELARIKARLAPTGRF